ncbi:MAG: J domain-containing protein [Fimbriimonadaceae bacterium]
MTGKRAYNLLRAYVGREWDRIKSLERLEAIEELKSSLNPETDWEPKEQERAASQYEAAVEHSPVDNPEKVAREILGVKEDASFTEVRKAFEKLNKRSNPSNFPVGSPEEKEASAIQKRIHWAYRKLTDGMGSSEKRFRSLEID